MPFTRNEMRDDALLKKSYLTVLKQEVLYPWLYSPIQLIDNFVDENRHLFTLIGVFGAVTVYLRTVDDEIGATSEWLGNFAVVSGLGLVILLSVILIVKLLLRVYGSGLWESMGLLVFAVFFVSLIAVISGVITAFPEALGVYYFLFVYGVGLALGVIIPMLLVRAANYGESQVETDLPVVTLLVLFGGTLVALLVAGTTPYVDMVSDPSFLQATPRANEWGPLFFGFLISFTAAVLVLMFVGVLIVTAIVLLVDGVLLAVGAVRRRLQEM